MANRPLLTEDTVREAHEAKEAVNQLTRAIERASADGQIDGEELTIIRQQAAHARREIQQAEDAAEHAHHATKFASAAMRGVMDGQYLQTLGIRAMRRPARIVPFPRVEADPVGAA